MIERPQVGLLLLFTILSSVSTWNVSFLLGGRKNKVEVIYEVLR